ncbi:MAG: hypothetical protein A2020_12100 [Lentisphaerae bacterium GWF2_45_14]|nr:MAG: hypothetical protein A2020_12100 [Lentisphaerae bacterium GWF2_45_14]
MNDDITGLVQHVNRVFKEYSEDRKDIEKKWQRNIDAFHRISTGKWKKCEGAESWQSQTFIGITKQKIVAAYSILIDTLLQQGKIPFTLELSPLCGQLIEDLPPEERAGVERKMELMSARINEQYADCNADRQLMKNVLSGAIYGETYARQSVIDVVKQGYRVVDGTQSASGKYERWEKFKIVKESPSWEYVACWNIFRDIESCDLQKSEAVIYREYMSPNELRKQSEKPFFIKDAIESAISESYSRSADSVDTSDLPPDKRNIVNRKKNIKVLEYWGRVPRKVADEFEKSLDEFQDWSLSDGDIDDGENEGDDVEVMCVVACDRVIRYVRIEEEMQRPFYRAVFEDDIDSTTGISPADNLEDVQVIMNGAVRSFEDNKKLASNIILALKRRLLHTQPGELKPGMILDVSEECEDVRQAVQQVVIQDVGESLLSMIELASRFADDDSNIPKIQQGQSIGGETAYELSQRLEKSGKYLGSVIRNYDEGLIEPITTSFLDYNMDDPEAEGKGNFTAKAKGFASFQEKATQLAGISKLLELVMSNEALQRKVKFEEVFRKFAAMLDVDADTWLKSDEEEAAEAQSEAQAQQAEMQMNMAKAQADTELTQANAQSVMAKTKIEAERLKLDQLNALKPVPQKAIS